MTTTEGIKVDSLTTSYDFSQIISDTTHIISNSSSWIYREWGSPILAPELPHQIAFAKVNLRIEYPPLYERFIWDYKNGHLINHAINSFNWEK